MHAQESTMCRNDLRLPSRSLRLVLWCIMREKPTAVNLMGPSCSSWGVPNRGTSMGSGWLHECTLSEHDDQPESSCNNFWAFCQVSWMYKKRFLIDEKLSVVLAILLMTAMHTTWLLEHPYCSLLHKHDRFEWLCNSVLYVAWSCN